MCHRVGHNDRLVPPRGIQLGDPPLGRLAHGQQHGRPSERVAVLPRQQQPLREVELLRRPDGDDVVHREDRRDGRPGQQVLGPVHDVDAAQTARENVLFPQRTRDLAAAGNFNRFGRAETDRVEDGESRRRGDHDELDVVTAVEPTQELTRVAPHAAAPVERVGENRGSHDRRRPGRRHAGTRDRRD